MSLFFAMASPISGGGEGGSPADEALYRHFIRMADARVDVQFICLGSRGLDIAFSKSTHRVHSSGARPPPAVGTNLPSLL